MLLSDLQNRLRTLLSQRIVAGEMTGTDLAHRAGFQQAHISKFLKGRTGLTVQTMDKVLGVLGLEVQDLIPESCGKTAAAVDADEAGFDLVPVVEPGALLHSDLRPSDVLESLRFKKSFLRRCRPAMASERESWQRFVLIKADKESGDAMRPRLARGAMLLIDRHYNSLRCYRRGDPNLYVVKTGADWQVRYVELQNGRLTLRPENQEYPLGFIQPAKGKTFADYVVGRVVHISMEM